MIDEVHSFDVMSEDGWHERVVLAPHARAWTWFRLRLILITAIAAVLILEVATHAA